MVNMDTWNTVLQLKDRVAVIKYELARINRFLLNPFENKKHTSNTRKDLWEKAAKKKVILENELAMTNKTLAKLVEQTKKRSRGKKK